MRCFLVFVAPIYASSQPRALCAPSPSTKASVTSFSDLNLIEPIQRALAAENYETPTPIQAQAIPPLLEGRDVLGCAQTGTGKTAAFCLPVLQHLARNGRRGGRRSIRALVLTPTRELAAQIGDSLQAYGRYLPQRYTVIFGGVKERAQIAELRRGIDVLVATPGRLLDLHGRGFVDLSDVDLFVLDEADRMLDMGFVHDVRRVISQLPRDRQNLLFSATMPPSIVKLAGSFLHDPVQVEVAPQSTTVELIDQRVMFVKRLDKRHLLAKLLADSNVDRAIVFTRTKHGANRLARQLERTNVRASAIHGNKSQAARTRALNAFRNGDIPVLIATDIASRGIDVDDVSHVFNFDLPNIPESYVHRIGRTARAGKGGVAISFCDDTEGEYLRDIEKLIGIDIQVVDDHAYHDPSAIPSPSAPRKAKSSSRRRRGGRSNAAPRGNARRPSGRGPRARQTGKTEGGSQGGGDNPRSKPRRGANQADGATANPRSRPRRGANTSGSTDENPRNRPRRGANSSDGAKDSPRNKPRRGTGKSDGAKDNPRNKPRRGTGKSDGAKPNPRNKPRRGAKPDGSKDNPRNNPKRGAAKPDGGTQGKRPPRKQRRRKPND